jgi:hypothetical protein
LLCKNPYYSKETGDLYGCGQCLFCRINRRREWTLRIMLESFCHPFNSFLTLTYDEVPLCGSVCTVHLRNFLKRLRKAVPNRIRFYACAEYGTKNLRPHYHLALFGVHPCRYIQPQNLKGVLTKGKTPGQITCQCPECQFIYNIWQKGIIYNARLEKDSAQYIASYIIDKMDKKTCDLYGLAPEFTRMSNRRGIGLGFDGEGLDFLFKFMKSDLGNDYLDKVGDVPHTINFGGKPWPLGNYLRRELRVRLGRDEKTPSHILEAVDLDRRLALAEWRKDNPLDASFTRNDRIDNEKMFRQKRLNKESKYKLYSQRKVKL